MSAGYGLSMVRSAAFVHCHALLSWGSRLADFRCLNVISSRQLTILVDSEKGRSGGIWAFLLKSIPVSKHVVVLLFHLTSHRNVLSPLTRQ